MTCEQPPQSGSTGNRPSDAPPPPAKDIGHPREVHEAPRIERAKTPAKSTGVGGPGNGQRELSSGGSGGGGDSHTSTFTSIAAKGMSILIDARLLCHPDRVRPILVVRPKLASLTNLRRSKSHHLSKSVSNTPTTNTPVQLSFICEGPEEPVPPPPAPFTRLVPREPVIRRSISLCDVKARAKLSRPGLPKWGTSPPPPPPKSSGGPSKREIKPIHRSISQSSVKKYNENLGARPRAHTSPIRAVNRNTTVYAPAPAVPISPSSPSRVTKHPVKPSLSLTLPNGVSIVHEPLLLSPIAPSIRSTIAPITPPPSRPPPRAHLPESPNDFNFGFDIKLEAWGAPAFSEPPPSASFSIASYYYNPPEANADYRDVITRYIELGDRESLQSLEIRNNGSWAASSSQLKIPIAGPGGSLKSPAQLIPLDRGSTLPAPEPIGNGRFPPLPPPPMHNKRLPATPTTRDESDEYADESTQYLRLRRSPSYRSHLTPVTPDTPPLLTPESGAALPLLPPWRADEIPYIPNQEVSILAKQPSLKKRSKRSLCRPATGF